MQGNVFPVVVMLISPYSLYAVENQTANPAAIPAIGDIKAAILDCFLQSSAKQVGKVPGLCKFSSDFFIINDWYLPDDDSNHINQPVEIHTTLMKDSCKGGNEERTSDDPDMRPADQLSVGGLLVEVPSVDVK